MQLTKREPAESLWANSSWENAISRQKISSFPLWYRSLVKRGFLNRSSRPHGGTRRARHDGTSFCQLHPPYPPFPCSVHHEDNLVQVRLPLICFDLSLSWLFQLLLVKSRPREVSFPTLIYLENHELLELFFFKNGHLRNSLKKQVSKSAKAIFSVVAVCIFKYRY